MANVESSSPTALRGSSQHRARQAPRRPRTAPTPPSASRCLQRSMYSPRASSPLFPARPCRRPHWSTPAQGAISHRYRRLVETAAEIRRPVCRSGTDSTAAPVRIDTPGTDAAGFTGFDSGRHGTGMRSRLAPPPGRPNRRDTTANAIGALRDARQPAKTETGSGFRPGAARTPQSPRYAGRRPRPPLPSRPPPQDSRSGMVE